MTALKAFFESLPILLACMAFGLALRAYPRQRRKTDRVAMVMIAVSSVLLIAAQSSWWHTVLVEHSNIGEMWANAIWTVFNTVVMTCHVIIAAGHHEAT